MADMDAVNSFNAELQSLYDVKPPISKGKMTSITRAALKAVKLYKHVVQSVEKFIQKCKAEYKIPGLYVIDSIIRQSRHQFGSEKDVFAPRFSRNIQNTFVHLYRCPEEDKAKIIRVLNLWQKNSIFTPEVIQPLFDLADPQNPMWEQVNNLNSNSESGNLKSLSGGGPSSNHAPGTNSSQLGFPSLPPVHFNKKVLDYDYGDGDDDIGQNSSSNPGKNSDMTNSNPNSGGPLDALGSILSNPEILRQLQTLQEQMAAAAAAAAHPSNYASTPEQERQRKLAELSKQEAAFDQRLAETVARLPFAKDCELPIAPDSDSRDTSGVDQNSNQLSSGQGANNPNVLLPPPFFQQLAEQQQQQQSQNQQHQQSSQQQQQLFQTLLRNASSAAQANQQNPFGLPMNFPIQGVPPPFPPQDPASSSTVPHHGLFGQSDASAFFNHINSNNQQHQQHLQQQPQITISQKIYEEIDLCAEDSKEDGESSSHQHRPGERDRSGRSKRSRSHDRHDSGRRGGRRSRSRSRSRGRNKRSYRSRSRERAREEREKEKERLRKGLPPVKKEHLSICSTTLWVGHLSKLVSQEEISDTFGTYGDIVSIDLISPRGCAFIVMNRRQDAVRALDRLKNTKLQGKTITLAWAPGKGMKGKEWKDYWEVGDGVSYIPWNKLREEINLEEFEDGGCIDEDTLPEFLRNRPQPPADGMKSFDQKTLVPPLPLDNENSQDSNSMMAPPLPPPTSMGAMPGAPPPPNAGLQSLLDSAALAAAVSKADTDARQEPPPPMPPAHFGMGPPGMGMMPMGMNLMVPPPMLAMGPGHFQGMAGLPMPPMMGMGMVPAPTLSVPPVSSAAPSGPPLGGGAGLLGEMPGGPPQPPGIPPQQLNESLLNSSNEESAMSASDFMMNNEDVPGSKRGKKRSRFDNPEEKMSPSGENSMDTGNFSPSQDASHVMKDDRPVFERLKSLAEGYSFGSQEKAVPGGASLLGNPPGLGPRPLLPNSFPQPPGLLGTRPVRPPSLFATGPSQPPGGGWGFGDNTENPFLNPNPNNPFAAAASAGNPFVAGNFSGSENPFDIVASSAGGNPFAPPAGSERGGFGGRRGGWGRDGGEWGGRGRGGRGGRGSWRGGRGGGGWGNEHIQTEEVLENDMESRGSFRGGRGGRGRDMWGGRGGDKPDRRDRGGDRDRPRSRDRDGDRGSSRSRRSRSPDQRRDDNDRGSRRRRNSSSNDKDRRSRHRSPGEGRRRGDRRQDNLPQSQTIEQDEDWENNVPQSQTVRQDEEDWEGEENWENEEQRNSNDNPTQSQGHEQNWVGDNMENSEIRDESTEGAGDDQMNSRLNESASSWGGENQDETEYPQEQVGEEDDGQYPSQSQQMEEMEGDNEDQYNTEMEEVRHHHDKTDQVGNYDEREGDGNGFYENNDNEYSGERHNQETYQENNGDTQEESYEQEEYENNHVEGAPTHNEDYNYEQDYNGEDNGGDYCAGDDYSGGGGDGGGDYEEQEPQSTTFSEDDHDHVEPKPIEADDPNTKCTYNSVNSNNSVPEEMNSISS